MPSAVRTGPNLFLVGAPKCGTTSLYEYLRKHPQIFFPTGEEESTYWHAKEPAYFCVDLNLPAEKSIKDDPNDIYTQQMLINAYAQKQMLYDLAVDRSEQ